MKCEECKFYENNCECHRFPPMARDYSDAAFPLVNNNNWCGEFVAAESSAPSNDAPEIESRATAPDAANESAPADPAAPATKSVQVESNSVSKPKRKYNRRNQK